MGKQLDRATKNFMVNKLQESIKTILNFLERENNVGEKLYQAYLEYIQSIADILLKDYVFEEYQILLKDISLIKQQDISNYSKLLQICSKLIDLGINIVENY